MVAAILPQIATELTMDLTVADLLVQALKNAQPVAREYHNALDRAMEYVRAGHSFTLHDNQLVSQSTSSDREYDTTLTSCDCPGAINGHFCRCRALLTICMAYQTMTAAAVVAVAAPRMQVLRATKRRTEPVTRQAVAPVWTPRRRSMSDAEYADALAAVDDLF